MMHEAQPLIITAPADPDPQVLQADSSAIAAANDEMPALGEAPAPTVIEIGRSAQGPTMIDLGRLLKTRMLITAGSGGGKSWCLRRFIEQAFGKVRIIVFDPEGELVSLADSFDFTVAAPDSETNPIYADAGAEAARAIYLSGRSTILSLSEFDGLEEMQLFVADFCKELLRMPANTWHHVLLVFDEAAIFGPQTDKSVSKKPFIDLTRRGRKRGMCPVVATQRLSELSKGVASHLENVMVGLSSLEVDIASAAKTLGMRPADARQVLRRLSNGNFVCFGPALSFDLVETKVGPVSTRHGSLEEYRGVASAASMSAEALGELLKSSRPAPAVDPSTLHCDEESEGRTHWIRPVTSRPSAGRRHGQRRNANLARSIDVACEIVHGRQIEAIASERGVTDQSVRNWLHAAMEHVDLNSFGLAAQPLRIEHLRASRHRIDTALRRAKLNAQSMTGAMSAVSNSGAGGSA